MRDDLDDFENLDNAGADRLPEDLQDDLPSPWAARAERSPSAEQDGAPSDQDSAYQETAELSGETSRAEGDGDDAEDSEPTTELPTTELPSDSSPDSQQANSVAGEGESGEGQSGEERSGESAPQQDATIFFDSSNLLGNVTRGAADQRASDPGTEVMEGGAAAGEPTTGANDNGAQDSEYAEKAESETYMATQVVEVPTKLAEQTGDHGSGDPNYKTLYYGGSDDPPTNGDADASGKRTPQSAPRWGTRPKITITTPPPSIGGYEIIEEIARGGMGVVYRARQPRLKRTVALKMILAGRFASENDVIRFFGEAEAAASLSHPNIVGIHEVGQDGGYHYFSMDFIEGHGLEELVIERPLEPRTAVRYVRIVAGAIQYAHEKGILHRDLKPSNILIDQNDQPLVTDFGLAKCMSAESNLTATGMALGTPGYMSPEQAAGDHQVVGPTSDVYSLGAILYHLLTGRPPFQAVNPVETIMMVLSKEPVPPRMLCDRIPRDLETITLKALSKDPVKRYQSAAELAEDLSRWERGEPIHARPVGRIERGYRWCRRNPKDAIVACLVFGVLVWRVISTQSENYKLQVQEARVREQYQRAEANYHRARDAVKAMLLEVGAEDLRDVPHMDHARKRLLLQALEFYQQFQKERPSDPEVALETARSYFQVARISEMLGRVADAEKAYRDSIDLASTLTARDPENADYAQVLAESQNYLGELARKTGKPAEAQASYRAAQKLQEQLVARRPDPAYQRQLARTLSNQGILYRETGQLPQSEELFLASIELLKRAVDADPKDAALRRQLAQSYLNLGPVMRATERAGQAEAAYLSAIKLLESLARSDPDDREIRLSLATAITNLGNVLLGDAARSEEAKRTLERSIQIFSELVTDFPGVPTYEKELANSHNTLGAVLWRAKNTAGAYEHWENARQILTEMVRLYPEVVEYHILLAGTLTNLSLTQPVENLTLSLALLDEAAAALTHAEKANPTSPLAREYRANHQRARSLTLLRAFDHEGLAAMAEEAHRRSEQTGASDIEPWRPYRDSAELFLKAEKAVQFDKKLPEVERTRLQQQYQGQALGMILQAVRHGFRDPEDLRRDSFASLHAIPAFEKLVRGLESEQAARP